jgi:hypothetical protein
MDSTAKPLLQLCQQRANLLRRTLEALEEQEPGAHWAVRTMDTLDRELESIERDIKWREKQNDGRDSE